MSENKRKRVLVTGATRGIGAATARLLLRSGFDVAALGRSEEGLRKLSLFAKTAGANVFELPCDLGSRAATDRALERLSDAWPDLHGVVLNAASNGPTPLDGPDTRLFDEIVEINLVSCMRLVRGLLDVVSEDGRIVAVASILGRFGIPVYHAYCSTKAGLIGFVRALSLELAPRRITVNAIVPGWVDTEMATESIAVQAPAMEMTPEEARGFFLGNVPLRRMLEPEEVAQSILHLLLPAAAGITGQAITIDCGVMA